MSEKETWIERVKETIDVDSWNRFEARYTQVLELDDGKKSSNVETRFETNYSKYFDLDTWLNYHVGVALILGLNKEAKPLSILDMGCGSGLLCKVAMAMGHTASGLDVSSPMYAGMAKVLDVPIVVKEIEAFTPLGADLGQYDMMTATSTKFDQPEFRFNGKPNWGVAEWTFFLKDCANHLNDGGRVYIKLNKQAHGGLYMDDATEAFFKQTAFSVDEPRAGHLFAKADLEALEI